MTRMPINKYQAYPTIPITNRQWPGKTISNAPIWCSVDLRDGNQALVDPMDGPRKHRMFKTCLLYTSPSPRDYAASRMPSSA